MERTAPRSPGKLTWVVLTVIALAIVAFLLFSRLDPSIVAAIESYGQTATGTDVSLQDAEVSLTESRGTLTGLTVGNPDGYTTDYALRVDQISLDIDLASLRGATLVIDEAVVQGAELNAEQRGDSSNLTDILAYMEQGDDVETATGGDDKIIIDRFRLVNGRIRLTSELVDGEQFIDLPEVVVADVGRATNGISYDEATEALLGPILAAARSAVRQRLQDAATDAVTEELEDAAEEELRELLRE